MIKYNKQILNKMESNNPEIQTIIVITGTVQQGYAAGLRP